MSRAKENAQRKINKPESSLKAGGPFQQGGILTMASGHALHDTYTAFLPPLLPVFIKNLALSRTEAGLLTVFTQAPSLIQPVIGHLADTRNLKALVFAAPAVTAALMSSIGIFSHYGYGVLALILILTGLSSAAFHAVGPVIAGRLSGKHLGRGMSFWMVGGELGRVLGPVVVVTSLRFLNLSGLSFLSVGGLILSFLLFLRLRDKQFRPGPEHPPLEWKRALKGMQAVMLPVAGLIFVRSFMMAALTVYLPTFLTEEGANLWLAGASLSILQGAGVAGAFLGGSLSDRLGRRVVLLASTLLVPLLMLVFLGWGGWIRFPLLIVLGFSLISMTPVIMALVQEQFPENRALANGLYMCLSFVVRSVVIILVGLLGDSLGLRKAFFIGALIMLAGIPLLIVLPGDHRDQKVRQWFFRESSPT